MIIWSKTSFQTIVVWIPLILTKFVVEHFLSFSTILSLLTWYWNFSVINFQKKWEFSIQIFLQYLLPVWKLSKSYHFESIDFSSIIRIIKKIFTIYRILSNNSGHHNRRGKLRILLSNLMQIQVTFWVQFHAGFTWFDEFFIIFLNFAISKVF